MSDNTKLTAFQQQTTLLAELAKLNAPLIVMQSALANAHKAFMDLTEGRQEELTPREMSDEERAGMGDLMDEMDEEHERMLKDLCMTEEQFSSLGMDGMNSAHDVWQLVFNRGSNK